MTVFNVNDMSQAVANQPDGCRDAFEHFIREHQRMIHSLCYRMSGSMEDAEDLAQETFVQAYRHWDEFRGEAKASSWLYRVAVNRCLNWNKRRRRQEQIQQEWSLQDSSVSHDAPQRLRFIQEALMKLPPKQRAAVVLTIYDGMNHAQAAAALNCSETTVSWRLFVARRKLKGLLRHFQNTGGGI